MSIYNKKYILDLHYIFTNHSVVEILCNPLNVNEICELLRNLCLNPIIVNSKEEVSTHYFSDVLIYTSELILFDGPLCSRHFLGKRRLLISYRTQDLRLPFQNLTYNKESRNYDYNSFVRYGFLLN